jgi:hypothetical protein
LANDTLPTCVSSSLLTGLASDFSHRSGQFLILAALRPDDAIEEVLDGRDHLANHGGRGGKSAPLDDISGQAAGGLPVPETISGAADQQARAGARRSAATVGSSVSSGVDHTAARPRSAISGAATDPSDFPMTTGAAPWPPSSPRPQTQPGKSPAG